MEYTLIHQDNPGSVQLEFTGTFNQSAVIWHTHFITLRSYLENNPKLKEQKQFIEISESSHGKMNLTVALNVPEITQQSISKMIIMIRQYRKLQLGIHEYGEALQQDNQ